MGVFDWLTGNRSPDLSVPRRSREELIAALMALNDPEKPWSVKPGEGKVDLVAEWDIVDAKWRELFGKAGMHNTFRVLMRLVDGESIVRSVDEEVEVVWDIGVPRISFGARRFRGQKMEVSGGISFGLKDDGGFGEQYRYSFSTSEIKKPIQQVVAESGWGWHGVAFAAL